MLNYIKSEFYRIARSKGVYLFTFGIAAFAFSINLLLFVMNQVEVDFPYGTIRFSLSNLISGIYLVMLVAGLLAVLLYSDDRKNGTMKNALSAGLSRTQHFVAKCVVACCVGVICMTVILAIYLGSAVLLLDDPADEAMAVLFQGIIAVLPTAIAGLVFAVASFHFIPNANAAQVFWIIVLFVVPIFIQTLGLYFEVCAMIASWLPTNIFLSQSLVTGSSFDCVWQTEFGMMKCLVTGLIMLVACAGFGLWRSNKIEF